MRGIHGHYVVPLVCECSLMENQYPGILDERKDHLVAFETDTNLARLIRGWTTFSTQPDLVTT